MDLRGVPQYKLDAVLDALPLLTEQFHDAALLQAVVDRDLPSVVARLEVLRGTTEKARPGSMESLDILLAPIPLAYIQRVITR